MLVCVIFMNPDSVRKCLHPQATMHNTSRMVYSSRMTHSASNLSCVDAPLGMVFTAVGIARAALHSSFYHLT
ncbi:hypothetical protein Y032_0269g829 [Ancylostoma ceylanicum]|uniref:Uncharacterized protein n=1 Tax=Ancylostoma ceylanicum TaxID=53326 RepID=A0A016S9J7_9BILA|nr:hypothetical protein Y032_0269g829 [Ancylostoma ceylanicum]